MTYEKEEALARVAIATYLICGLLTFGYSAANCKIDYKSDDEGPVACDPFFAATGASLAAMLWPFYWSWTAFEADNT